MNLFFNVFALIIYLIFCPIKEISAQVLLSGSISNGRSEKLSGVNVYIKHSFMGTTSDSLGFYQLEVKRLDTVVFSYLGMQTEEFVVKEEGRNIQKDIVLKPGLNSLTEFLIVGQSNNEIEKLASRHYSQLEILVSPGLPGSIMSALNNNGDGVNIDPATGKLIVRGGRSNETQFYLNGLQVRSPYIATPKGLATQTNQSPMMLDHIEIINGAFSIEYDHALSSIVLLQTPKHDISDLFSINLHTLGSNINFSKSVGPFDVVMNSEFVDLTLGQYLSPSGVSWINPYSSFTNQLLLQSNDQKVSLLLSGMNNDLAVNTLYEQNMEDIALENKNRSAYLNFHHLFNEALRWNVDLSTQMDNRSVDIEQVLDQYRRNDWVQLKSTIKRYGDNNFHQRFGAEWIYSSASQEVKFDQLPLNVKHRINTHRFSGFGEAEYSFRKRMQFRMGYRLSYFDNLNKFDHTYRLQTKINIIDYLSASLFHGSFLQPLSDEYLFYDPKRSYQKSKQSILSLALDYPQRRISLSGYVKNYHQLLRYSGDYRSCNQCLNNKGHGQMHGFDIEYKDFQWVNRGVLKLNYSFVDGHILALDYETERLPSYLYQHHLLINYKQFLPSLSSYATLSFKYAWNRFYDNPVLSGLQTDRVNDLILVNINYTLLGKWFKKVDSYLNFSIQNVFNKRNQVSFIYSQDGIPQRRYSNYGIRFFMAFINEF